MMDFFFSSEIQLRSLNQTVHLVGITSYMHPHLCVYVKHRGWTFQSLNLKTLLKQIKQTWPVKPRKTSGWRRVNYKAGKQSTACFTSFKCAGFSLVLLSNPVHSSLTVVAQLETICIFHIEIFFLRVPEKIFLLSHLLMLVCGSAFWSCQEHCQS